VRTLRFGLLLLAAAVVLFLPARAQAQWFEVCGSTWRNTCSVVRAEADKMMIDGQQRWVLRIYWKNISPDIAGIEGENSVATRMLINVQDQEGNPLFSEQFHSTTGGPLDGEQTDWADWRLTTKEKGGDPYAYPKIGWEGWTGEINNRGNNGDGGSCIGVVTPWSFELPCGNNKNKTPDHRELFVGVIVYGLASDANLEPWLANVAVQHQRVYSADCDASDPYCQSDWAVVPEPITMILVGTGLAGIGGVAALRRRREDKLENE
jgi:hypothetical protein